MQFGFKKGVYKVFSILDLGSSGDLDCMETFVVCFKTSPQLLHLFICDAGLLQSSRKSFVDYKTSPLLSEHCLTNFFLLLLLFLDERILFNKLFQNMWRGSYPFCKNTVTIQ